MIGKRAPFAVKNIAFLPDLMRLFALGRLVGLATLLYAQFKYNGGLF